MPKLIDFTGKRFGRLTVMSRADNSPCGSVRWHCLCDCGGKSIAQACGLKSGGTSSCGCLHRDAITTHGHHKKPEYAVWKTMMDRCNNPKNKKYSIYGARGIFVCDRWSGDDGLINFLADMGPRTSPSHSIDRVNNDGPYGPLNCRWATQAEQQNNRRDNRSLTLNGETRNISQWARHIGIDPSIIYHRISAGWPVDKALNQSIRRTERG